MDAMKISDYAQKRTAYEEQKQKNLHDVTNILKKQQEIEKEKKEERRRKVRAKEELKKQQELVLMR